MSSLLFVLIAFGAIVLWNTIKSGPSTRGGDGSSPARRRGAAAPFRASRLPPPPGPAASSLPPPPPPPVDAPDPAVAANEADEDEPMAADEDEPMAEDTTTSGTAEASAPGPDLDTVIRSVFGDDGTPRERSARFDVAYADATITWTANAVRSFTTRRGSDKLVRVELFLGYTSEAERFSERVMAEAFFAADTIIERDTTITFRATLAEANVYARRLVLVDAVLTA